MALADERILVTQHRHQRIIITILQRLNFRVQTVFKPMPAIDTQPNRDDSALTIGVRAFIHKTTVKVLIVMGKHIRGD